MLLTGSESIADGKFILLGHLGQVPMAIWICCPTIRQAQVTPRTRSQLEILRLLKPAEAIVMRSILQSALRSVEGAGNAARSAGTSVVLLLVGGCQLSLF